MDRDRTLLLERIGEQATLRDLGARHGMSAEGVRKAIRRATHEHIRDIVVDLWEAQAAGQVLVLAIPAGLDEDQGRAIDYLRWTLAELERLWGVRADVRYLPAPDGTIAFALTDPQMPGGKP